MEKRRTWAIFENGTVEDLGQSRSVGLNRFPQEWGDSFIMRSSRKPQGPGRRGTSHFAEASPGAGKGSDKYFTRDCRHEYRDCLEKFEKKIRAIEDDPSLSPGFKKSEIARIQATKRMHCAVVLQDCENYNGRP